MQSDHPALDVLEDWDRLAEQVWLVFEISRIHLYLPSHLYLYLPSHLNFICHPICICICHSICISYLPVRHPLQCHPIHRENLITFKPELVIHGVSQQQRTDETMQNPISVAVSPSFFQCPKILKHLIWPYHWQFLHILIEVSTFFQCPAVSGLSHREDCLHKDSHWALKSQLQLLILCFVIVIVIVDLMFWGCRRWWRSGHLGRVNPTDNTESKTSLARALQLKYWEYLSHQNIANLFYCEWRYLWQWCWCTFSNSTVWIDIERDFGRHRGILLPEPGLQQTIIRIFQSVFFIDIYVRKINCQIRSYQEEAVKKCWMISKSNEKVPGDIKV